MDRKEKQKGRKVKKKIRENRREAAETDQLSCPVYTSQGINLTNQNQNGEKIIIIVKCISNGYIEC